MFLNKGPLLFVITALIFLVIIFKFNKVLEWSNKLSTIGAAIIKVYVYFWANLKCFLGHQFLYYKLKVCWIFFFIERSAAKSYHRKMHLNKS